MNELNITDVERDFADEHAQELKRASDTGNLPLHLSAALAKYRDKLGAKHSSHVVELEARIQLLEDELAAALAEKAELQEKQTHGKKHG